MEPHSNNVMTGSRVGSFLAVGLVLLAGAFAYPWARVPLLRERHEAG